MRCVASATVKHVANFHLADFSTTEVMTAQSGWAQNNEFDKLACEPCLTTRCVGAMKRMAFELQSCVENLVLFRSCDFRSDCADSPFVVARQTWDRLRFARTDCLFLASRPRVKPM